MIFVEQPGQHTTIQDMGRLHHRAEGISVGGAADALAMRVANMLVGNPEDAACIECALVGPVLRFDCDAIIAVCGATIVDVETWKPIQMRAGKTLQLDLMRDGAYAYVAVRGGIDVPMVLGSRSTDTRIGWGGVEGRALKLGDSLAIQSSQLSQPFKNWRVAYDNWYRKNKPVRVVLGSEAQEFMGLLEYPEFKVTAQSDRMGVRLSGYSFAREGGAELSSGPVAPGTIQIPPDGNPIILLADAQTLGGYPKIAHVISHDLPRAAQLRPGSKVRFRHIDLEEAHALLDKREAELSLLRQAVADKLKVR
jgi:antagonist of KipI